MTKILVIDDDEAIRQVMELRLQQWGYEVMVADNGEESLLLLDSESPDILIADVVMPGLTGFDVLERSRERNPERAVLLITAHADVDMAVEAMKKGAADFITKPIQYDQLKALLEEIEREQKLRSRARELRASVLKDRDFGSFVGNSKPMKKVYRLIRDVAVTDAPVLISGESGTGKELVARMIHDLSPRATKPFLALNAAAIPSELIESELFGHEKGAFTGAASSRAGCFEQADRGTLFLDEISEMPAGLQAKLLRVLEDKRVRRIGSRKELQFDVRVLAATNRIPAKAVKEGLIRTDLYYRLNVFHIELPRLTERTGDLQRLALFFIGNLNTKHGTEVEGVSDEVEDLFTNYPWPGNVRELRNIIERAVVLAKRGWIKSQHLPPYIRGAGKYPAHRITFPAGTPLEEVEKELILKTLQATENNKAQTARLLGVDVKTIRNKLKRYGRPA